MMGIPTAAELKAMADDELQKVLDDLKAREDALFSYLDSRKIVITFEPKEKQ